MSIHKEFKVGPTTYQYNQNKEVLVNGVPNKNYSPAFIEGDFIGVHNNQTSELFMINNVKPQKTVSSDDIDLSI